jgi:manganese/zinc/iron transport system permease protein
MNPDFEIILTASLVSAACSLPGIFLVLRKMSMMSDAIGHAILPGIVIGFFLTHNLNSPWLIIGAGIAGLLTVLAVEVVNKNALIKEDASIGMVFPMFFSVGVILVTLFASNVHLDTDAVLLGELAFVPFDRFWFNGVNMGPRVAWVMGIILIVNLLMMSLFFKELKLSTFDKALAASLGFIPVMIHYGLMASVSITAVAAFDAVGSILVVAFMVVPAAISYLLTDNLKLMVFYAVLAGVVCSIGGYYLAVWLDSSIAGAITTVLGVALMGAFFLSPEKGYLYMVRLRRIQRYEFAELALLIHIENHSGSEAEKTENRRDHLQEHFSWEKVFSDKVLMNLKRKQLLSDEAGLLKLTERGERFVETKKQDFFSVA